MSSRAKQPAKKNRAAALWHALVIILVGLAAWYFIDFGEVAKSIASITPAWLAVILLLATIDRFLMAGKWLHLLRHVRNPARFPAVLSAYYQSAFVQRFLPSSLGGDALRALIISSRYGAGSGVLATMVVEKLIAMFTATFLAICGGLMVLSRAHDDSIEILLVSIPLLMMVMLVVLRLTLHRPLVLGIINRLPWIRAREGLIAIYDHYSGFRHAPQVLVANFIYSLIEQILQIVLLLCCALALNVAADIFTIIAAVAVAQCLRKLAIILEGWLFGEFTAVLVYSLLGIPEAQALAFSLLGHAAHIVASLPGAVLFARSSIRLSDIRNQFSREKNTS
ncbi:lysylphosphatidylglycerol synthase transmembrane domain-containing protein [Wenzhouxiangella sp. XN24]|uniref:lysylphosphatidylglycerol synthase transmembrane domain-containing protein n=1 Tax=Wenzhouxiangella sp. XN24 TaxID=2713569 RepID=UPI0013EAA481|nr:lysylphosphatidylglycerol synthase transmembrane domain-containing protein [Wenzhouxiangella sp. XN24]NGX16860.1 flippase-like domain-containing protein [Wenzhouxiangella sp. XN24]